MIAVSGLALLGILVGGLIPGTPFPILNVMMKGAFVAFLFLGPVFYFRLSPDLNEFLLKNLAKIRGLLGKGPH